MSLAKPGHKLVIVQPARKIKDKMWVMDHDTKSMWSFAVSVKLLATSRMAAYEALLKKIKDQKQPFLQRLDELEEKRKTISGLMFNEIRSRSPAATKQYIEKLEALHAGQSESGQPASAAPSEGNPGE